MKLKEDGLTDSFCEKEITFILMKCFAMDSGGEVSRKATRIFYDFLVKTKEVRKCHKTPQQRCCDVSSYSRSWCKWTDRTTYESVGA